MKLSDLQQSPELVRRAKLVLGEVPDGDLWTYVQLAKALNRSMPRVYQAIAADPTLAAYRVRCGRHVYWGNRATIRKARKALNEKATRHP